MIQRSKDRKKGYFSRIVFLGIFFFVFWALIILRLIQLQIIEHPKYKAAAENLRIFEREQEAERGIIFVEENNRKIPVALNNYSYTLYAVPRHISQPEETALKIAQVLEISIDERSSAFQEILEKISAKESWYKILKKDLTQEQANKIKEHRLTGIGIEKEIKRFYPEENYFSHLLGFWGYLRDQKEGRYGIEEYYENILSGKKGLIKGERSVGDILIPTADSFLQKSKDGSDIVLTINRVVQNKTCEILEEAIIDYQLSGGTIIVVEPETGRILSLCNWPNFNPNEYGKVDNISVYSNTAVVSQFEPGSIFKVITLAAGIEDKKITPETVFEDTGSVKIGGYTIKNAADRIYGKTNARVILEQSINTGAVFVAREVGLERFLYWVKKFGFGEKTEIDLPAEAKGNINNLYKKSEIYLATASFGHGIAVTPLQMVMSFAAIANNGKLMKPYLVEEIISDSHSFKNEPQEITQVISPASAEVVKDLMISAVKEGWGKRAAVDGYLVAGKTGTAEIPDPRGTGYSDRTIHSFIGFTPADRPKFVILVKLDNPALFRFSDRTAAPTFSKLADFLLKHYQIPPTEE